MRENTTVEVIHRFMELMGSRMRESAQVYFTGGITALLHGWRDSTVDVDLAVIPEVDSFLRQIPDIKEELKINVELASPVDFVPELPGWKDRSLFIVTHGPVSFYHYDPYSQALSKIERGHTQDVEDVKNLFKSGLVKAAKLQDLFSQIQGQLYRYPAVDPKSLEAAVRAAVKLTLY